MLLIVRPVHIWEKAYIRLQSLQQLPGPVACFLEPMLVSGWALRDNRSNIPVTRETDHKYKAQI